MFFFQLLTYGNCINYYYMLCKLLMSNIHESFLLSTNREKMMKPLAHSLCSVITAKS